MRSFSMLTVVLHLLRVPLMKTAGVLTVHPVKLNCRTVVEEAPVDLLRHKQSKTIPGTFRTYDSSKIALYFKVV